MKKEKQLLKSPVFWVSTLYFAMGLPYVIASQTSALMFKDLGISDKEITFWATLVLFPWTIKFLWSPFLELFKTKKFFAILTQYVSGISFVFIAFTLPLDHFFTYSIALLGLIALCGSTHDVVADGIYLNELDAKQQATYIGWQGAFYNIAKLLSFGGITWMAGYLSKEMGVVKGWATVIIAIGILLILLATYHTWRLPTGGKAKTITDTNTVWSELKQVIGDFFHKKHIFYYFAFIILYRFAEGLAMKIVPLFLKSSREVGGLGLDNETVGLIYGIGTFAFVVGSILGGYTIAHWGLKKSLFKLCLAFNLPFIAYFMLSYFQPTGFWSITAAVGVEYWGYGYGFVGLTYFMMQQIAPGKYKMAHYAIASGIMNLGVMIPSMASGWISDTIGYKNFFIFVLIATIPALLITYFVPFTQKDNN